MERPREFVMTFLVQRLNSLDIKLHKAANKAWHSPVLYLKWEIQNK